MGGNRTEDRTRSIGIPRDVGSRRTAIADDILNARADGNLILALGFVGHLQIRARVTTIALHKVAIGHAQLVAKRVAVGEKRLRRTISVIAEAAP